MATSQAASFVAVLIAAAALGGGAFAGCTGSSSESPWPAEPADVDLNQNAEDERPLPSAQPMAEPTSRTPKAKAKAKASSSASIPANVRAP